MNKRILTLVLAFVMILGLAVTSFAAPEAEKITNPKVQWLIDKNIVVGRLQDDGKTTVYDLDKTITREEVAKLVILYRGSENLARSLQGTKGIFKDVAIERWSNGYINVAALADLIVGYPDGNFGPEKDITYAEIAAILVRMNSKWTAADEKAAIWPISFIKAAEEFGILKGIKLEDANAPAVREKVFEMMYNAFDGKYQAPIVNDRLGVISKIWGNSIQLNGKDEYKITDKTIFVGNTLKKLFIANDFYGSLVRIAVNDDNEITHLIALGSNGFAYEKDKWDGIIDEKTGGVYLVKETPTSNPADISDKSDNDKVVFLGDLTLKITDKTRFFVADADNNNFFEAKKLSDAIDTKEPAHLQKVYAAYDVQPVTGEKYAKVVVFSSGKEAEANKNLARITASVGAGYDFKAEDTSAIETEYSVAKANKFPYNYKLHKMDVVNLHMSGDKDVVDFKTVIDYAKADVFEVVEIDTARYQRDGTVKFDGNYIILRDKNKQEKKFALDVNGVSVFTNALGEGAHVQISFKKDTNDQVIDVISKVDKALKGQLKDYTPGKVCGILYNFEIDAAGDYYYRLKVTTEGHEYENKYANFKVGEKEVFAFNTKLNANFGTALSEDDSLAGTDDGVDLEAKGIVICGIETGVIDKWIAKLVIEEEALNNCKAEAEALDKAFKEFDVSTITDTPSNYDESDADQVKAYKAGKALLQKFEDASDCVKANFTADTEKTALKGRVDGVTTELETRETARKALETQKQIITLAVKGNNYADASDLKTAVDGFITDPKVTCAAATDLKVEGSDPDKVYTIKISHSDLTGEDMTFTAEQ